MIDERGWRLCDVDDALFVCVKYVCGVCSLPMIMVPISVSSVFENLIKRSVALASKYLISSEANTRSASTLVAATPSFHSGKGCVKRNDYEVKCS